MPERGIRGKTALVTGAAKRIGWQTALSLAEEGVNVIVHYASSEGEADGAVRELKGKGVNAWKIKADFADKGYEGLVKKAADMAGSLDILVNNASIFPRNTLADITFEDFIRNMEINAWAPFSLSREFARDIGRGKIINMLDSRVSGYDWTHVDYILSKHVLAELTKMTAVEYAPHITVNGVSPGLILPPPGKDMSYIEKMNRTVPLKKHGNPVDIAEAIIYLLKSDFLTGEVINVDGGRHVMEYDHGPHPD